MALTSFPLFPASICFSTFLYSLTQNANQWWLITFSDNSVDPDSALHMHLPFWLMNVNQGWQFTFANGWKELLEMQYVSKLKLPFILLQLHWKQMHAPENLVVIIREYLKYRNKIHAAQACFHYFDLMKDLYISIQCKHQMILKHHFNVYINLYYTGSLKKPDSFSTK